MATTAYLRVSTGTQDLANQKLAILEYARRKKFPIHEFVEVQISSRKKPHQRGIDGMLERLAPGDRLIVSELSRLGRSLGQVIHIVDELVKRKIRFTAIKESIHLEGKQDLQTKVMVALFGLFAEVERDLISERTREGLASARAKGRLLGRPKGVCWESRGWKGKRKKSAFSCKNRSQRRPSPRLSASRGPPFTALSRQGGYAHILKGYFTPIWSGPFIRKSSDK
jgi:DNA invertase Pin-like site-specific DNA recombinase